MISAKPRDCGAKRARAPFENSIEIPSGPAAVRASGTVRPSTPIDLMVDTIDMAGSETVTLVMPNLVTLYPHEITTGRQSTKFESGPRKHLAWRYLRH